jgi:hypothetical protein
MRGNDDRALTLADMHMVAVVIAAMAGCFGAEFDHERSAVDFARAMKVDSNFRAKVQQAYKAIRLRRRATPLTAFRPMLNALRQACGRVHAKNRGR